MLTTASFIGDNDWDESFSRGSTLGGILAAGTRAGGEFGFDFLAKDLLTCRGKQGANISAEKAFATFCAKHPQGQFPAKGIRHSAIPLVVKQVCLSSV